jgi:hypothetical protein
MNASLDKYLDAIMMKVIIGWEQRDASEVTKLGGLGRLGRLGKQIQETPNKNAYISYPAMI